MPTEFNDFSVGLGGSVSLSDYLSVTNHPLYLDGYQLWDDTGAFSFYVNGQAVDATSGYYIEKSLLASTTVIAATTAGTETLWARALYNSSYQDWDSAIMTTTSGTGGGTNTPPTVTMDDITLQTNEWRNIANDVMWSDAQGNPPTWYQIWDNEGSNSFWVDGMGTVDATNGMWLTAQQMSTLHVRGEATAGTQTLWVRGWDTEAGDWDSFTLTTTASGSTGGANTPPTVTVEDINVGIGEWEYFGDNVNWSDPDGTAPTWYQIWDNDGSNSFWINGQGFVDATQGLWVTAADMANTWVRGETFNDLGSNYNSTQTLWVRGWDTEAGAWDSFDLITG